MERLEFNTPRRKHAPVMTFPELGLYFRFALSYRDVEELMVVRGIVVTFEAIREWCPKFGQTFGNDLGRRRPRPGDKWHSDEVFLKFKGQAALPAEEPDAHGRLFVLNLSAIRSSAA